MLAVRSLCSNQTTHTCIVKQVVLHAADAFVFVVKATKICEKNDYAVFSSNQCSTRVPKEILIGCIKNGQCSDIFLAFSCLQKNESAFTTHLIAGPNPVANVYHYTSNQFLSSLTLSFVSFSMCLCNDDTVFHVDLFEIQFCKIYFILITH